MHAYNLRSRVNSPAAASLRGSPGITPSLKTQSNPTPRVQQPPVVLQLDHVIGTTTKSSSGLSSCLETNSFAYCAGSVAVLADIDEYGTVTRRYYRARPAAIALNASSSYYSTPSSTPTRKRRPLVTPKKDQENPTLGRSLREDDNAKTWTARERIKSIRCVSLSPNGRLLAVGETGYNPRVLIFSTAKGASTEVPLSIINDHTWGVKSVAFSLDSRYLASLGESNDGFLFVWGINPRSGAVKLYATNKCTTNVCHMTWCGQRLITAGTRHVKVWYLPGAERSSPSKTTRLREVLERSPAAGPTPLPGRNCLLGDLANLTFTCVVAISDQRILICTDVGSLCFVDVSKNPAEVVALNLESCCTTAVGYREGPRRLVWAGGGGDVQEASVEDVMQRDELTTEQPRASLGRMGSASRGRKGSALRQSLGLSQLNQRGTVAVSCLTKHTICIDADSNLVLTSTWHSGSPTQTSLSSHSESIQGVQVLPRNAGLGAFFTWSRRGELRFWTSDARILRVERIELDEGSDVGDAASNELKVLRYYSEGVLISGDRFGVLKLMKCGEQGFELSSTARAHSAEVNDICIDNTSTFVATCSRDRIVQVFRTGNSLLELLQTTDDHIAAVNQVMFSQDGNLLLSCSADRTIVVREKVFREHGANMLVAFLQTRIITIKASPLCMCLVPGQENILYVSALDRHITKVDFASGAILENFKVAESDMDDHAVLNAIQVTTSTGIGSQRAVLVGCSSTDKSVRIYDLQRNVLLSKESAHTEGISDIALLRDYASGQNEEMFVSTGHDSTVMIWSVGVNKQLPVTPAIELTQEQAMRVYDADNTPTKASPATLPPLRKVLTKLDIAEFVKSAPLNSPALRNPSPAQLKRKGSKLALTSSAIAETNENTSPTLQRRASADDRPKLERRSPSPPAYATRRSKKPTTRGEIAKDFFTRQSEWLPRSPSPEDTPIATTLKQDSGVKNSRLRRPPSVPMDLRARALAQERYISRNKAPSKSAVISTATEQASWVLKSYKKKLEATQEEVDLLEVEQDLESVLEVIRRKRTRKDGTVQTQKMGMTSKSRLRLKRQSSAIEVSTATVPEEQMQSSSTTGSETNSPIYESNIGKHSLTSESTHQAVDPSAGLGVDGLSVLMRKATLTES